MHPATPLRWFLYHPDAGTAFFATEAEALDSARLWIEEERPVDGDAWPSDLLNIVVGKVTQRATETNHQYPPDHVDEEGYGDDGLYWDNEIDYRCDVEMMPLPEEP